MARLRKFLALTGAKRLLLLRAFVLLWTLRLALWLMPYRFVKKRVARASTRRGTDTRLSPDDIAWCVDTAGRFVVGDGNCLVHAMTAQVLFGRRGIEHTLRVGVVKDGRGELEAHAWIEHGDRIIIGGVGAERFKSILVVKGEAGQ
jgi:hypothetical protein